MASFPEALQYDAKVLSESRPSRARTINELLMAREMFGSHTQRILLNKEGYRHRKYITTEELSSKVAWNPARLKNMILAVGPNTPASFCWNNQDDSDDEDNDESSEDGQEVSSTQMDVEGLAEDPLEETSLVMEDEKQRDEDQDEEDDEDDDDDDDDEEEQEDDGESDREALYQARTRTFRFIGRQVVRTQSDSDSSTSSDEEYNHARRSGPSCVPSIRHAGCINTAAWLACPWRLSTVKDDRLCESSSAYPLDSVECPTQLVTSGDDQLLKFWDASAAMGMASPIPGGWDTFCPLACAEVPSTKFEKTCKSFYRHRQRHIPGNITHLMTLSTGHRGNVFHVEPVKAQRGKVLTCGADGYLRMCDVSSERSSVVIRPSRGGEDWHPFFSNSGMAFSHQFLTANTGLLCSERGLHHFDLRLPAREQISRSLIAQEGIGQPKSTSCKTCAVWNPPGISLEEVGSSYVFAGGSSPYVKLYDLRMEGSHRNCIVQNYKPRHISKNANVSVSGLDISKDGRELLVSYENDQIYSFPIFHEAASSAGPTLCEIDQYIADYSEENEVRDLLAYGGHLNRYTFLKNAKYAGPLDEYICTGSDSGHAWIYERKTGCVAGFMGADCRTCNGVIPHPSLPFFITYGIDSTAKLWRATCPVDRKVDFSRSGREECAKSIPAELSPLTFDWRAVQSGIDYAIPSHYPIFPDFVPRKDIIRDSAQGGFFGRPKRGVLGLEGPRIGNALRALPMTIQRNVFECAWAERTKKDPPVESSLSNFVFFAALIRLKYQADRLGLIWDPAKPWAFKSNESELDHPCDLIPDRPSDWVLFDPSMNLFAFRSRSDQLDLLGSQYYDVLNRTFPDGTYHVEERTGDDESLVPWISCERLNSLLDQADKIWPVPCESRKNPDQVKKSRMLLYHTASLLKSGGTDAMKKHKYEAAVERYDKAIQYCALALLDYKDLHMDSELTRQQFKESQDSMGKRQRAIVVWSPLLRILITTRLNLALLFLKEEYQKPRLASKNAREALLLLEPFVVSENAAPGPSDLEPKEVYKEAMSLQAKAYFREGSAQLELNNESAAIKAFERSLKSTSGSSPNTKPDSLVVRRLHEAKRKHRTKLKDRQLRWQRALRSRESSMETKDEDSETEC